MDWSEYAPLYKAEKAAYHAYQEAQAPPNGARVRPKQVKQAEHAWYAALDARYTVEQRIAAELGCKRWQVPVLYHAETTTTKDVKR